MGVLHSSTFQCLHPGFIKMRLVAPQDATPQHLTLLMDAFPRRIDRADYKKAGAASWGKPQVVSPKVHHKYWENALWDAYRRMDPKFVLLLGEWPQDLFRECLDPDLRIADEIKLRMWKWMGYFQGMIDQPGWEEDQL